MTRMNPELDGHSPEVVEFVRFCYRRRRVGWPELYDEMCAVASRGLYRGWDHDDLAAQGISFGLAGMPELATIVRRLVEEDAASRPTVARRVEPDAVAARSAPAAAADGAPVPEPASAAAGLVGGQDATIGTSAGAAAGLVPIPVAGSFDVRIVRPLELADDEAEDAPSADQAVREPGIPGSIEASVAV